MAVRTVVYGGFTLEREVEPLPSPFQTDLAETARHALVQALLAGETPHPDQGKLRRALERFGHFWRRSGGRLAQAQGDRLAEQIARQLAHVLSWDDFIAARVVLDPDAAIPEAERHRLDALPASVNLYGDRVPLDYDIEQGVGVVRMRLKEGQARRLQARDIPPLDRPVRFTVTRGKHDALRAASLEELRDGLRALVRRDRRPGRGGPSRRGRPPDLRQEGRARRRGKPHRPHT